ncbi:MAG: hypothetical protein D6709_00220 [Chloroflexi bacterium]|jgi:arginase family enzyme|nr:MAG: hypothetical protein D6709_00220 [Chloroflexota bacterium]
MAHHVHLIGVPMDLGQRRRGVDIGPSVIRYAGLHQQLRALGHTITDSGNIAVPILLGAFGDQGGFSANSPARGCAPDVPGSPRLHVDDARRGR